MPKRVLTDAAVQRIKPPASGQIDHFDKGYPGFALRLSYGGARSWVYFFRLGGKQRRFTLGAFPAMKLAEARNAWRKAHEAVAMGNDPTGSERAGDDFAAVAEEWLKRDQGKNRSVSEVRRLLERDVLPAWRGRLIGSIGRRDAIGLIDRISDRAPTLARRVHSHLHRLFRWSVGRGIIPISPMADLPKPGEEIRRNRVLSDHELVLAWKAADALGWPFGPVFQLLILTGARLEEIGSLCWSEVDFGHAEIRLDGTRTKNGEPHTIHLSATTLAILNQLPRVVGSDFVFSTTGRTSISGWSRAKGGFDAKMMALNDGPLHAWRTHDLRRTVATGLQRLSVSLQTIEAVLGHVSGSRAGIVGVYQRHSFDSEKKVALDAWSVFVEQLVSGEPVGNVVALRA